MHGAQFRFMLRLSFSYEVYFIRLNKWLVDLSLWGPSCILLSQSWGCHCSITFLAPWGLELWDSEGSVLGL